MDDDRSFRSYNEQLFPQAVDVLEKIRYSSEKIQEFLRLVEHIKVSRSRSA